MRPRSLIVVASLLLLATCKDGEDTPGPGADEAPAAAAIPKIPAELEGSPWGEIVTLRGELWALFEQGSEDPDTLVGALDGWYRENDDRLRTACLEAAQRPLSEPDAWREPLGAFSLWQRDVARPRGEALRNTLRDPRLIERLQLFDERCLDAASSAAPNARGEPEDPWARYVALRKELHALLEAGISKPRATLRAGATWYEVHDAEIRATCLRMAALSGAPENAARIAAYTDYLGTEGQHQVEKLVAKIPAMVPAPGDAKGLFDLMNRFDRICAEATRPGA
jgi:hypothetical protein